MKRMGLVLLLAVALGSPAFAEILPTGENPAAPFIVSPPSQLIQNGCAVLWFGSNTANDIVRLQGLGFSITQTTNPADLNPANLAGYELLIVAFTGPGVIGTAQAVIEAYVASGHGLLIHQPNHVGLVDYAPAGFEANITDIYWCGGASGPYQATIVNGSHPITMGLIDDDLSGDFDYVSAIGAGYTLLAQNAVCLTPSLAAGDLGPGRIVFETGNPIGVDPGSDRYWISILNWLCEAEGVLPVELDIKPMSCPNPFNVKARGVLPVAILGSATFNVRDIDPASITLAGVAPLRWKCEDVAAPAMGIGCECTMAGPDGYRDLTLKFSREEITAVLGMVMPDQEIELTIEGLLQDGTAFAGTDCIVIRPNAPDLMAEPGADIGVEMEGPGSERAGSDLKPAGEEGVLPSTWGEIKTRFK